MWVRRRAAGRPGLHNAPIQPAPLSHARAIPCTNDYKPNLNFPNKHTRDGFSDSPASPLRPRRRRHCWLDGRIHAASFRLCAVCTTIELSVCQTDSSANQPLRPSVRGFQGRQQTGRADMAGRGRWEGGGRKRKERVAAGQAELATRKTSSGPSQ